MTGGPDPLYVKARTALLDALEVLEPHLPSLTLVGAQAIYLHVGEADLAVAPFTMDADLGIDPRSLAEIPPIERTLLERGFHRGSNPGAWFGPNKVQVDLLVAETLAGKGRERSAEVGDVHGEKTARRADGLEATLVDFEVADIASFELERDPRSFRLRVAGPGALLIAKLRKLGERVETATTKPGPKATARLKEKDALDVFRLLLLPTENLARRIDIALRDDLSRKAAERSLLHLRELFSSPDARGNQLLQSAVELPASPAPPRFDFSREVYQCVALTGELLAALKA